MFRIQISSGRYGIETFEYASEKKQLAGFKRLLKAAKKHQFEDSEPRSIIFQVGECSMSGLSGCVHSRQPYRVDNRGHSQAKPKLKPHRIKA